SKICACQKGLAIHGGVPCCHPTRTCTFQCVRGVSLLLCEWDGMRRHTHAERSVAALPPPFAFSRNVNRCRYVKRNGQEIPAIVGLFVYVCVCVFCSLQPFVVLLLPILLLLLDVLLLLLLLLLVPFFVARISALNSIIGAQHCSCMGVPVVCVHEFAKSNFLLTIIFGGFGFEGSKPPPNTCRSLSLSLSASVAPSFFGF
ncbi:Hypothetical predicted protein, partial [Drosophila guanche]